MRKILVGLLSALLAINAQAATFSLFSPATGVLKGNSSSYVTSAATSADIIGLFSSCSGSQYLGADGACHSVLSTPVTVANGGTGATTLSGVLKGNGTSAVTSAASSDVRGLWTGTCNSSTFLRGDGACAAAGGGSSFGNSWDWATTSNQLTFVSPLSANTYFSVIDDAMMGVTNYDVTINGDISLLSTAGNIVLTANAGSVTTPSDITVTNNGGMTGVDISTTGVGVTNNVNAQAGAGLTNASTGNQASAEVALGNDGSINFLRGITGSGYLAGSGNIITSGGSNGQQGYLVTTSTVPIVFATNRVQQMSIAGAGGITVGAPTGGSQGLGTINATNLFVNGTSVTSASVFSSGTLAVARGGTNLTAAADDNVMVGNGTTWQSKTLPNCGDASHALAYATSTNTFSCQAVTGNPASGSGNGQVLFNSSGAFAGSAFFTWDGSLVNLTQDGGNTGVFLSSSIGSITAETNSNGLASIQSRNDFIGTVAKAEMSMVNDNVNGPFIGATSSGFSGTVVTNGPSGEQVYIDSHGAIPITIGINGTEAARIFSTRGVTIGNPTGGDKGAGTINASNLYVNGTAVATGGGTSSTFTGTVTGVSGTVTCTIHYQLENSVATLFVDGAGSCTGTSNATTFTITGLPSAVTPTHNVSTTTVATDNGNDVMAGVVATNTNTLTFYLGSPLSSTGWTASGTKGITTASITYGLRN